MNQITEGHTVKRYDQELTRLHELVLKIGVLARAQLQRAVQSLKNKDTEAAREVIVRDREINALDIQADDELVRLIAKRHPLARDLRETLTIGKAVTDLERAGDEARKIARLTIHLYDTDSPAPGNPLLRDIHTMAAFVDNMLAQCLEAFDEIDLQKALATIRMDLELEEEYKSALRRLTTFVMEDARSVGHVIDIALGLRALERIGGHAKNIAGYVVFLAAGMDVRHERLEDIAQKIAQAL